MKNFQIQHKLGSGSYGVIYKALNKPNRCICVLKQINLSRMNEKAKKNAVNQATIMGKLNHPFIVRYQDSFIEDRTLNIVMEYCDGGDLAYYLKQQNKKYLKEQKIWKFFLQICMGLEHIHKNKILHRDIKTLNIFLNKNEQVKIGDLGVAKLLANNDFAQTMVGTPFYLSPQLCEEKPYNQKSDIWAMGCLLYQLCTFRHPFQAANQASLILKIIRGKYSPIPEFYSKDLKDMIDSCLERDYKRRPTANMILNKPRIKQLIEQYKLNDVIETENKKNSLNTGPRQIPKKVESKVVEKKNPISTEKQKTEIQKEKKAQIPKKPVEKAEIPKNKVPQKPKEQKKVISKALDVYVPEQKIVKEIQVKQHHPQEPKKVLFGQKLENKADFISKLEKQVKDEPPKIVKKQQKKTPPPPTYFEIPWKDKELISQKKSQNLKQKIQKQPEEKIIVHSQRHELGRETPIEKKKEVIHKVKMQKEVQPRVFESQKQMRPKGIIKSGGFSEDIKNPMEQRKKSEIISKIQEKKLGEMQKQSNKIPQKGQQQPIYRSEKNIKNDFNEKPSSILGRKRESNPGVHFPPRVRKNPRQEVEKGQQVEKKKNPRDKATSQSRYSEITKEEEDLVANLPDIVKKGERQSDSQDEDEINMNKKFKLNQINDDIVLKKYEELLQSKKEKLYQQKNQQEKEQKMEESNEQENLHRKQSQEEVIEDIQIPNQSVNVQIQEQNMGENEQAQEQQQSHSIDDDEQTKINYEEDIYQINNFDMDGNLQDLGHRPTQESNRHQWSFDEEPELPLLEESQAPFFEEANPYLVEEKGEEESLEDKKQHLQIRLKQNMKRQDQINRLMQIKIDECKAMVPKGFDEILIFFRKKINMDKEYTDQDEREVESFLRRRNLTDHRKFQNIYKIMHFEMELENTRKIIQTICKKLNDLEK